MLLYHLTATTHSTVETGAIVKFGSAVGFAVTTTASDSAGMQRENADEGGD